MSRPAASPTRPKFEDGKFPSLIPAALGYGRRHIDYATYIKPKLSADTKLYDSHPHPVRGSKGNWSRFENDELRSDREVNWKSRKEDLVALPRVGLGYKPVPDATPDLVAQYWEKFLPKGFDAEKILVQRAGITSIW